MVNVMMDLLMLQLVLYIIIFELAKTISNEQTCLIFPARWIFGSGKGLQNSQMICCKTLK